MKGGKCINKSKIKNKVVVFISVILIVLCTNIINYAKYNFENIYTAISIDIDRNIPKIELIELSNTNVGYEKYANKTHTITAKIKVTEKNIIQNNFNKDNIKILVNEKEIKPENFEIKELSKNKESIIYEVKLKGLTGDGTLKIKINEGTIVDKSNNKNLEKLINTEINIDNTLPITKFTEKEISQGKVNAVIDSNEAIRKMDGWNISADNLKLTKEFSNNVSYIFEVMDFAQNKSKIEVNITKATNIKIVYGSHNSEVGWTFGYGNYDVAGKAAVKINPILKTESLAFHVDGNVDKDFIQAQAFVYSYWGEGSKATCDTYNTPYSYGSNPSSTKFSSMLSGTLVNVNNKKSFIFGGSGINSKDKTDINGKNPIPKEYEGKYAFGISGIKMKLKDYSNYSIVYQILVNNHGWQTVASDGQNAMYKYNRPMSAFRMALIPKTEKKYLIELWNKDVGTYNLK